MKFKLFFNITNELDKFFDISESEPDVAMKNILPSLYKSQGIDYTSFLNPDFCYRFNGIMFSPRKDIKRVLLATFPTAEILDKILNKNICDALLFVHHPVDYISDEIGFLPLRPAYIQKLIKNNICIYSCHAPLDVRDDIGTT